MSVRVSVGVAAGAACFLISQQSVAQSASDTVELPEIVVTTPSPVVKPAKKKARAKAPGLAGEPAATASAAQQPSTPDLQPLPGGIVNHDSFVAVTVTTERELVSNGGPTITDTLMTKPGISGSTFAPGANRPIIRGLDSYRVRTQEDGIGTHDVAAISEDHAVPIDPFSARQVEVVRGPGTLRYGSQAIGGIVNATNDRIPDFVPRNGIKAELMGGLSSVDDGRDGGFQVTTGSGGVALHADAFKRRTDDYDTPHGVQPNTYVESEGGAVGGSLVGLDGFIGLSYSRFASLYGIPGEEAVEENSRIDMAQTKLLSKGEWRPKSNGVDAVRYWFGWSDYAHNELVDEGEIGSRFTNRELEGRVELQHAPVMTGLGELTGAVGVQAGHRRLSGLSFEGDSLLDPSRTRSIAGFVFEELQATRNLRLQAAARYESTEVEGTGIDLMGSGGLITASPTFRPVSGSFGLLYSLPLDVTARLNAQHVERAPETAELFSKGAHEATGTFEIGNPNLSKEKADTFELGFQKATGAVRFDAAAYYTHFDGFIYRDLTGDSCDADLASCMPGGGGEYAQVLFDQRDATFYGIELQGELDVGRVWNGVWGVEAQYDFVHATFDDGGYVPRMPPHRLGGGLFYRDAEWVARTSLLHAFAQNQLAANETETGSYTLLNAEVSYTFTGEAGIDGIRPVTTIGVRGDNLLDDDVRNSASFKKDEVLLPGASVRLFGTVKLN